MSTITKRGLAYLSWNAGCGRLLLPPALYLRLLRDIRAQADTIEARLDPKTPQQRKALTQAVRGMQHLASELASRHLAQIGADGKWIEAST